MYHHCCTFLQVCRASNPPGLQCTLHLSPYTPHPQTRHGEPPHQHHPNPDDQVSTGWGVRVCLEPACASLVSFHLNSKPSPSLGFPSFEHVQHLLLPERLFLLLQFRNRASEVVLSLLWMISGFRYQPGKASTVCVGLCLFLGSLQATGGRSIQL